MTDTELARVRWQCRRGMLELDTLLGDFVDMHYSTLSDYERRILDNLLGYPDQLLFEYFFGKSKPTDREVSNVIERIRKTYPA